MKTSDENAYKVIAGRETIRYDSLVQNELDVERKLKLPSKLSPVHTNQLLERIGLAGWHTDKHEHSHTVRGLFKKKKYHSEPELIGDGFFHRRANHTAALVIFCLG